MAEIKFMGTLGCGEYLMKMPLGDIWKRGHHRHYQIFFAVYERICTIWKIRSDMGSHLPGAVSAAIRS